MSYIRALEKLRYADGPDGLYAYPSDEHVVIMPGESVLKADWIEITMRMLERQDVDDETMETVQSALEAELMEDVEHDESSRQWGNLPDSECPTCLSEVDSNSVNTRWGDRIEANLKELQQLSEESE